MTKPSYEERLAKLKEFMKPHFISEDEMAACKTLPEFLKLWRFDLCKTSTETDHAIFLTEHWYERELARVRGLLQRQDDLWMGAICGECENGDRPCQLHGEWIHALSEGDVPCPAMLVFKTVANFRESSSLVSQGAESADIGKLDAADEKWKRGIPPSEIWACNGCGEEYRIGAKCDLCPTELQSGVEMGKEKIVAAEITTAGWTKMKEAGSAETGGEKADYKSFMSGVEYAVREAWRVRPESAVESNMQDRIVAQIRTLRDTAEYKNVRPLLATSPRSSQNQTVSTGVEGAHEGIAADKSGSREPEKLNNAHPEEFCDCCGARLVPDSGQGQAICPRCDVPQNLPSRLAESSLSSPPRQFICASCLHGVAQHEFQDAQSSSCLACGCKGYRERVSAPDWYEAERRNTNLQNLSEVYAESFLRWVSELDRPLSDHRLGIIKFLNAHQARVTDLLATVRQSSSLTERGAESAHSGKLNTADKSGLLPTQLPKWVCAQCPNCQAAVLVDPAGRKPTKLATQLPKEK